MQSGSNGIPKGRAKVCPTAVTVFATFEQLALCARTTNTSDQSGSAAAVITNPPNACGRQSFSGGRTAAQDVSEANPAIRPRATDPLERLKFGLVYGFRPGERGISS
jgi:hypothetical protein